VPAAEADDLVAALEAFVRETVLPRTYPHTTERHWVLEALSEAGGLCTAQTVELPTGDVIVCTHETGHYDPDNKPFRGRETPRLAPRQRVDLGQLSRVLAPARGRLRNRRNKTSGQGNVCDSAP
jgi:hypothetical protein